MANNKIPFLIAIMAVLVLASCKKEQESRTVITSIEEPHISKTPKSIGDTAVNNNFQWGSATYSCRIERKAVKNDSCTVKDEDGQKYYDNKVTLTVSGPDGQIFNKTFSKENFSAFVNPDYINPRNSVLIGIAFNNVEKGGNAIFVATVGSPDSQSDEFMSIKIQVDKNGAITMSNLQQIQDEPDDESSEN